MKPIDKILIALIIALVLVSAIGTCNKKQVKFVTDKHAITQAVERFRIAELQLQKKSDSLEREALSPRYKYLRGEIIYKNHYDTLTITQYVHTTDSIISVDSALIAVQDSIINHYVVYSNDLIVERDSIVESNIELTAKNEKYIQQKKRRLNAFLASASMLFTTWYFLLR